MKCVGKGMLGGRAAEYILYSRDKEELFQAFRNEMTNSLIHPLPKSFLFFRWLFQILDTDQGLQRKWEWQVFKMSRGYCRGYVSF